MRNGSSAIEYLFRKLPRRWRDFLKDSKCFFLWSLFQNIQLGYGKKAKFYSQSGEDEIISKYLPESYGSYLDIGAGQAVVGSNTYFFYKMGWTGICVDPIASNFRMLQILRSRDISIQCLVSTTRGKVQFFEFIPYEYSTTMRAIANRLETTEGIRLKSIRQLEAKPLSIFAPLMDPLSPTLLSIDVEGADLDVLKSNDWTKTLPRVTCVEELEQMSENKSLVQNFLENLDYVLVERTSLSSIYVHKRFLFRKEISG